VIKGLSWVIKRLFNEKTVGYLLKMVEPRLQEVLDEYLINSVENLLTDEEFHKKLTTVTDAYYERYRRKVVGTLGAVQQGLNKEVGVSSPDFDFFDAEGRLSVKKIIPMLLSGGFRGIFGGNKTQNRPQTGDGGQNAPNM